VIVPAHAATFSALGLLLADVVKDYSRTIMAAGSLSFSDLQGLMTPFEQRARADLAAEGIAPDAVRLEPSLDVRLQGQSYDLNIPLTPGWLAGFEHLYRETYGYFPENETVEIVNLRLRARGKIPKPQFEPAPPGDPDPARALIGMRDLWQPGGSTPTPVYDADRLEHGCTLAGPALLTRTDTTIWLPPGTDAKVDGFGNLIVNI
jgi:N-methylhydantoinase A